MHNQDCLIVTSRIVVRSALVLNRLFLAAVCLGMASSWVFAARFAGVLIRGDPDADATAELTGLRLEMLIGIVMAVATDRLLVALARMIDSAREGDPFITANAQRLRMIGWSLLVLQLLDIAGALLARIVPSLGAAAPAGDVSAGGWVAVLMVFILARVFAAGAAMRDDLAGTI